MTTPQNRITARGIARAAAALWLASVLAAAAQADVPDGQALRSDIAALLEAAPLPAVSIGPRQRYLLLVHKRGLEPRGHSAEPIVAVADLLVNPRTLAPYDPLGYFGITVIDLLDGSRQAISVPENATIGFPQWSPDGTRFAFTVTGEDGIELWLSTPESAESSRLLGPMLHGAAGKPCAWMPDSQRLVCKKRLSPRSQPFPSPQATGFSDFQTRAALGLLSRHTEVVDEDVAARMLEARLEIVTLSGERRPLGNPAAFESLEPAPGGDLLLVTRRLPPYVQTARASAQRTVEVWRTAGPEPRALAFEPAADAPPRALQWHASKPATLVWAEQTNGQDRVLTQAAPFLAAPRAIFSTPHRFAGLQFLQTSPQMLISAFDRESRETRLWVVDTSGASEPRLFGSRSIDTGLSALGRPLTTTNAFGKSVVTMERGGIYLRGQQRNEAGIETYLDFQPLDGSASERIWQSTRGFEPVAELLAREHLLLTRHESSREPANYILHDLRASTKRPLTGYTHPAPALKQVRSVPLRYARGDDYQLASTLHLPPAQDADRPVPLIIWAYPRQYGADTRSVATHQSERFLDFDRAFKLFFLLEGYAVIDDLAMPVIGNSNVNDTFIEQIVANARAAITAARGTGLVDTQRVGIAGHSYGAFMVANLLAHSRLFDAGIAMSGAYNRTLTPFGFQTERRTLWEARETYLNLSPLLYSDRIEAPLLLVHGLLDRNAGTQPIQSIHFYEAIRRNGGQAELLLLPHEDHSYRGRESVLETAATMLEWFDRHLKDQKDGASIEPETYASAPR